MVGFDLLGPFPRTIDGHIYVEVFVDRQVDRACQTQEPTRCYGIRGAAMDVLVHSWKELVPTRLIISDQRIESANDKTI